MKSLLITFLLFLGLPLAAQDESGTDLDVTIDLVSGAPLPLDISRRDLKNFLTDEEALKPYLKADGTPGPFQSIFMIGSVNAPYAIFWDPTACRLVGALDLEAPIKEQDAEGEPTSPYIFKASGPAPFSKSSEAFGDPEFFGFRIVNGKPVFLYSHGGHAIEERIWLDDGGSKLRSLVTVRDAEESVTLTFPPEMKDILSSEAGEWDETTLTVPAEEASQILLTYRLEEQPETETTPEN